MNCCSQRAVEGTGKFFSKHSRKYLKQFRKKGLAKEQRYLVEGIMQSSLQGKSILEIGCGVGGLHLTLLKHGAVSAIGIDVAEGMLEGARSLSKELGVEDRTRYVPGDFVRMDEEIGSADISILDKVVCCYEDVNTLVKISLAKTQEIYALSYPRPNNAVKLFIHIPIILGKLLNWSFYPYWHDWNAMEKTIEESGFKQTYENATFFWTVRVFKKSE